MPVFSLQLKNGFLQRLWPGADGANQASQPGVTVCGGDRFHQRHRHWHRPVVGCQKIIQILREPGLAFRLQDRQGKEIPRGSHLRAAYRLYALAERVGEVSKRLAFKPRPGVQRFRVLADLHDIILMARRPPRGHRIGAGILVVRQDSVVVEQQAVKGRVAGEILINIADRITHLTIPWR